MLTLGQMGCFTTALMSYGVYDDRKWEEWKKGLANTFISFCSILCKWSFFSFILHPGHYFLCRIQIGVVNNSFEHIKIFELGKLGLIRWILSRRSAVAWTPCKLLQWIIHHYLASGKRIPLALLPEWKRVESIEG